MSLFALFAAAALAGQPAPSPDPGQQAVAAGNRAFAVDLYRELARHEHGNIFFSPYSIGTAFGPLEAGAGGATRAALDRTLHYPVSGDRLATDLGGLTRTLGSGQDEVTLEIANALWLSPLAGVRPVFVANGQRAYGAAVASLDFSQPAAAAARINDWADARTHHRIPHLVDPSDLPADTNLVVTNAVYFLGSWAEPFEAESTHQEAFNVAAGQAVDARFMGRSGAYRLYRQGDFQALDLPYSGERFAMTILLPDATDGLDALEESLSAATLNEVFRGLDREREAPTIVAMPKLQFRTGYRLRDALIAMGLAPAFSNLADFGGVSERPTKIGDVIHQALLRIDERGTEAAAATAVVGIVVTGLRVDHSRRFIANHPYLMILRDRLTDAILFMGRVVRPEQEAE